jgi:acyl carrier protein
METGCADRILELAASAAGRSLARDEKIDLESLEFLDLVKDIENDFGVRVPDNEFIHLNTAEDFCRVVEAQLSARVG